MRAYTATTTARDPARLNRGGHLTTFDGTLPRGQTFAPFDITDIAAFSFQNLPAGTYLGFSFRQVGCSPPRGCRMELGFGADTSPRPVLSVTYDVPDPPMAAVPEPTSWALMIGGFGLAGPALRRRRAGAAAV